MQNLDRGCSSLTPLWACERSEYGLRGDAGQWGEATSIEVAVQTALSQFFSYFCLCNGHTPPALRTLSGKPFLIGSLRSLGPNLGEELLTRCNSLVDRVFEFPL